MHLRVVTEHDPETGSYSAVCPELPGCASAAQTEAEALANVREAIGLYLEPDEEEIRPPRKVHQIAV